MACGCKERCKRWRASLKRWEARIHNAIAKRMIRTLRKNLLQCEDE